MYKRRLNDENERPNDDKDGLKKVKVKNVKTSASNSNNVLVDLTQNEETEEDDDIDCVEDDDDELDEYDDDDDGEDYGEDEEGNYEYYNKQVGKTKKGNKKKQEEEEVDEDESIDLNDKKIALMKQIQVLIQNAKPSGSESIGGEATELPVHPALFIKDFGHVPLPLNEMIAESLIKLSAKSPYGLNEKTLIDAKVRDSFQIEPSLIDIKNPDWNSNLHKLVERVAKGLGCHGKIEPKLYKLLIYRKGGHFKKHRDTEKDKNMFATMVLQLPSIHEGGELVIYHKNNKKDVYDFGQSTGKAPYTVNFVAHYADVEHEIREVKSGYRLALIYSLCWVDGNSTNITKDSDTIGTLANCLKGLSKKGSYQIGITLDHQYTPSSFRQNGIKALKGIDNDRYHQLISANARLSTEQQLSFYIAHTELVVESYEVTGNEDYGDESYDEPNDGEDKSDWEECERNKDIKEWYNVDGVPCFNNAKIDLESLTYIIDPNSKKLFSDMDKELSYGKERHVQIEGYTGNEGVNKTTTYNRYILFFWPKSNEFTIFMDMNSDVAVESLHVQLKTSYNDPIYIKNFSALIKKLTDTHKSIHSKTVHKVLEIFEKVQNVDLFKTFMTKVTCWCQPALLTNLIIIYKWDVVKKCLSNILLPITQMKLLKNLELIQELLCKDKSVACDCLKHAVLPILNKPEEFIKSRYNDVGGSSSYCTYPRIGEDSKVSLETLGYIKLAETIVRFDKSQMDFDELSCKFSELIAYEKEHAVQILLDLIKRFSGRQDLLNFIKYDVLFKALNKFLNPNSIPKAAKNCDFIKILCDINQMDAAFECFNEIVLPVLDKFELFFAYNLSLQHCNYPSAKKFTGQYTQKDKSEIYYKLAETILLFKHKNIEQTIEKYVNLVLKVITDKDQHILAELLDYFNKRSDHFCSFKPILKLYELRFNWLAPLVAKTNENLSWSMPGTIPGHSKLDNFLRSEQQQMIYSGSFNGIWDARKFASDYEGFRNGYSLNMTASGVGKRAQVLIVKSKDYYENELKKYKSYNAEFKRIEKILKSSKN